MPSRSAPFPESVGRFVVQALLGAGGMGEVYKAIDPTLRRMVAVKTVRPDITSPDYLSRLLREAQACASLTHPNIVTVYEAGEIDGAVYMVMEYLEGEDLGQVLHRGALTFEERIRTLMQILDALEHAHRKGVIHRDIKPSNIRRLPDGTIKLVDFGLARMTKAETLTATGTIMGTPHYASPEQLQGQPIDRRTDIYSTGTMAYEMCSGRRPFEDEHASLTSIMLRVVSEPPPPMNVSWSNTFPEIERIVTRAMAKTREDRYQSAEDMKNAFAAFLAQSRDAIASAQAHESVTAQRTVIEARGLVASGKSGDAQSLLAETLKVNPHASGLRQFLDELSTVTPPPAADTETMAPRGVPTPASPDEVAMPVSAGAVAQTVVDDRSAADRTTMPPPRQSPVQPAPAPPAPPSSRKLWWIGGTAAAAAAVVGVIALPSLTNVATSEPAAINASVAATVPPSLGVAAPIVETPGAPAAPQPAGVAPGQAAPPTAAAPPAQLAANTAAAAKPAPVKDTGAKSMFYQDAEASASGAPPSAAPTGLRYRLTQAATGGGETDVDPAKAVFKSGDRVRFAFESNIDGYLYVVQEGSSGRWTVLFPSPEINNGRNAIRHSEEYLVPPDGWFAFDANPGTEQVFVFLSKEPMSELPGFDKPVTRRESLNASVVESLQNSIRSRDLTFERDTRPQAQGGKIIQASYVVNRAELGKAVSVSITLNHTQY